MNQIIRTLEDLKRFNLIRSYTDKFDFINVAFKQAHTNQTKFINGADQIVNFQEHTITINKAMHGMDLSIAHHTILQMIENHTVEIDSLRKLVIILNAKI